MNQRSYTKRGLLLLSLGLVSGCASAYRATNTSGDISSGASVEMVVLNQTQNAVRVYLIWEDRGGLGTSRSRRLLSQIQGGETGTFTVPQRWRRISLAVELVRPENLGALPSPVGGIQRGEVVDIEPGDLLHWEIEQFGGLYSVQLTAHYSPDAGRRVSAQGRVN